MGVKVTNTQAYHFNSNSVVTFIIGVNNDSYKFQGVQIKKRIKNYAFQTN